MKQHYKTLAYAFSIPGMAMQIFALMLQGQPALADTRQYWIVVSLLIGTVLCFVGFGLYAKAKGRSMLWGVLALLSFLGLVILAVVKDKSDPSTNG